MNETEGKVQITYDINANWEEVKATLISEYHYYDTVMNDSFTKICVLPNTTLNHQNKRVSVAIADIQAVCLKHNVILEKASAALISETAYFDRR